MASRAPLVFCSELPTGMRQEGKSRWGGLAEITTQHTVECPSPLGLVPSLTK